MCLHVLLVDSEDLRKVQNLDLPFFERLTADPSMHNFFSVVVVFSNDLQELLFAYLLGF